MSCVELFQGSPYYILCGVLIYSERESFDCDHPYRDSSNHISRLCTERKGLFKMQFCASGVQAGKDIEL